MLLMAPVFRINLILTVEFFVLLAALFFCAYVAKNQLSKWLRYSGIAVSVIMALIIVCTAVNSLRMRAYCRANNYTMGQMDCCMGMGPGCGPMMKGKMKGGCYPMMDKKYKHEWKEDKDEMNEKEEPMKENEQPKPMEQEKK